MDNVGVPVHCHYNGSFENESGHLKYIGGSCRLCFIREGDSLSELKEQFFKFMKTTQEECDLEIKFSYAGNTDSFVEIVDDEDVRNIPKLYSTHAWLLELYAVKQMKEFVIPTCEPDEIDQALTDEHLDMLISGKSLDKCTPIDLNVDICGSSAHPILIEDDENDEVATCIIPSKEEEFCDDDFCVGTFSSNWHCRTYRALDVVSFASRQEVNSGFDEFDKEDFDEDLELNYATAEATGFLIDIDQLLEGQTYSSQADFKKALKAYAMKKGFEYTPTKCNYSKITARCIVQDCPWRIKARVLAGLNQWWVKKFDSIHTCSRAIGGLGHRNCDENFIAMVVRDQVVANEKYTPKMIQTDIQRLYGVNISYWKAYRARENILDVVRGDFEGSYGSLPSYMRELKMADGDTCVQLEYQDEGRFHRFFWAFGAPIRAFQKNCRPLIGLDGTFLTGKYRGALLTASCLDGNNCILPLAWAVVEGENRSSWQWFLERMLEGIVANHVVRTINNTLTFISDRQKGLLEAVGDVFPDAAHGFCMYHLSTNLPNAPKNSPAWRRFWAAARAYTVAEFNEIMEKMKDLHPDQFTYVSKLPKQRWATHCFIGRRYSMLTSNCAETINSVIRPLKGLPITYLVEETRRKTASYFYKRKKLGEKMTTVLATNVEKLLENSKETARFYTLNPSTDVLFQVIAPTSTEIVDLSKRTCSCRRWEVDGIPCTHAMASISWRNGDPYMYVEDWFKTSTFCDTYNDYVPPTRGKEQWPPLPSGIVKPRPPNVRIQPGRRKLARKESIANGLVKKRCTNCHKYGHNKRSCKNTPVVVYNQESRNDKN